MLAFIHDISILKQWVAKDPEVFTESGEGGRDTGNAIFLFISLPLLCLPAGVSGVETTFKAVLLCMKGFIFVPCILYSKEDLYKEKVSRKTIK